MAGATLSPAILCLIPAVSVERGATQARPLVSTVPRGPWVALSRYVAASLDIAAATSASRSAAAI
jgi:hypothetical protein